MAYQLISDLTPSGDQPEAIRQLLEGIRRGDRHQTLLGVTGSGKTFTISNVIKEINKPVLVMSHNKTLAAQLYAEFKNYFPKNRVEFFISYYDYYQPEAYVPTTDTYIAKDSSVNDEIDRLRLRATSALLSGDPNVIVVASVSCIYGIGAPDEWISQTFRPELTFGSATRPDGLVIDAHGRIHFPVFKGPFGINRVRKSGPRPVDEQLLGTLLAATRQQRGCQDDRHSFCTAHVHKFHVVFRRLPR